MSTTEDIRSVFSEFHDGNISAWTGDKNHLTITIDCQYLAERINKSFDKFYLELMHIDELSLSTWPHPNDLPMRILTEPADIFEAELEILSANIKGEKVIIACNQQNSKFDYCGGNLSINCQAIKIFDQGKNEIPIEEFEMICKSYWAAWREKFICQ